MTHLVAIDNGYKNTKIYTNNFELCINSKYEETAEESIGTKNTFQFIYEGKKYLVGEGCFNVEIDKTNNPLHRLITYCALAYYSTKSCVNDYNLVAMYPLISYNQVNKELYANYLKTDKPLFVTVNGKSTSIHINKILVIPQCASSIYTNPQLYKDKLVGVVDIGGLTVQGCIFDNLNLVRESIFSINLGQIVLFNKIRKKLNSLYNVNVQDYEIPYILRSEQYKVDVEELIATHLQEIRRHMKSTNWNVELLPLVFTGGGSLDLQDYIPNIFPSSAISNTGLFDNVRGAYKVGEFQFNK